MTDRDLQILKAIAAMGGGRKAVRPPYKYDVQICVTGLIMDGYIKKVRTHSDLVIITDKGLEALSQK